MLRSVTAFRYAALSGSDAHKRPAHAAVLAFLIVHIQTSSAVGLRAEVRDRVAKAPVTERLKP